MRLFFLSLAIFLVALPGPAPAQTAARPSLLQKLADLPAPAPFDPPEKEAAKERSADFMDEENVPPDDAPIEDLLDYWTQSYANFFRPNTARSRRPKLSKGFWTTARNTPKSFRGISGSSRRNQTSPIP